MRLPYLPKRFKKTEMSTLGFLGLNLTDNYREGELDDCKNLSSLNFPALSQRKGRTLVDDYEDVTDVYSWGDKLVVVANNMLYIDGEQITNVNDEPKHFAVVNTKLVVHPDMICIDLKNNKLTDMKASVTSIKSENAVIFSHNNITFSLETVVKKDLQKNYRGYSGNKWTPYTYTFGSNVSAFLQCWDSDTGAWDWDKLNLLKHDSSLAFGWNDNGTRKIVDGEIIIPSITENNGIVSYDIVYADAYRTKSAIDTDLFNDVGVYAIIKWNDKYESYAATGHEFASYYLYDVYDANQRQPLMSDVFKKGDVLDMTGTPLKLFDTTIDETKEDMTTVSKVIIKDLVCDDETMVNTIIVEDNTYAIPKYVRAFSTKQKATGTKGFCLATGSTSGQYLLIDSLRSFGGNTALLVYDEFRSGNTTVVKEWDYENRKFVAEYTGTFATSRDYTDYAPYLATSTFQSYVDQCNIKFQRAMPDLDFICERDNRLWGVSNKDGTIYGSALGLPWVFYDYSGIDTDSYSVAVGSGGDFTGIVNYNGVLCFKEDKVHKLLGSYPSEFYINTYEVSGIQKNAHMSAKTVSEILYYKSPVGVVAFTGYQPSNISNQLAMENTRGGVAASDGREYYISTQAKDGSHSSFLKYDLTNRLWLKEGEENVHAMTYCDGTLYAAISVKRTVEDSSGETVEVTERNLYKLGQENDEMVEWFARFKPFMEDVVINNRKMKPTGFVKFIMRLQMAKGSTLTIKKKEDDGRWEHVWNQPATQKLVNTIPIKVGRCDKFELMLEGKGNTKIISMEREVLGNGKTTDVY